MHRYGKRNTAQKHRRETKPKQIKAKQIAKAINFLQNIED
jgi:hypothetical protein